MSQTLLAYAKLNLDLYVFASQNGYHPIDSIFASVGLADRVQVSEVRLQDSGFGIRDSGFEVAFTGPFSNNIPAATNTVTKTLEVLERYLILHNFAIHDSTELVEVNSQFTIEIEKNIPSNAGLGGGSADAAGVLVGLNQILKLGLDEETLMAMGAEVGSDVPFFIKGGTARVTGRGEKIQPLPPLSGWIALIKPKEIACPTSEIYKRFDDLTQHPAPSTQHLPITDLRPSFHNDLYHAVFSLHPEYEQWLWRLKRAGFGKSALTGSGACFFAWVPSESLAQRACALFETEKFDSWALPLMAQSLTWQTSLQSTAI